jgi:acylphosphatase
MLKTISIIVTGKVQGVFYRQSAKEKARELGVNGAVRNEADGSVRIVASGTPVQLNEFVAWCTKGPSGAIVQNITTAAVPFQDFKHFQIERN